MGEDKVARDTLAVTPIWVREKTDTQTEIEKWAWCPMFGEDGPAFLVVHVVGLNEDQDYWVARYREAPMSRAEELNDEVWGTKEEAMAEAEGYVADK